MMAYAPTLRALARAAILGTAMLGSAMLGAVLSGPVRVANADVGLSVTVGDRHGRPARHGRDWHHNHGPRDRDRRWSGCAQSWFPGRTLLRERTGQV